jgi:hypothetical protein
MRIAIGLGCALAMSACIDLDFGTQWDLGGNWGFGDLGDSANAPVLQVGLYDDGTTLLVTGCPAWGWFGCVQPDPASSVSPMSVTLDEVVHEAPLYGKTAELLEEPEPRFPLRLTVASPAYPYASVSHDSVVGGATLVPPFSVTAPGRLSRSAGPLRIEYEALQGYAASAIVMTSCGRFEQISDILREEQPGTFAIDLAPLTPGTRECSHEVRLAQRTTEVNGKIVFEKNRIQIISVRSAP